MLLDKTQEELTAQQAEVVAVGKAAWCDTEDCERPHAHPPIGIPHTHYVGLADGDWVLLAPRSLTEGPDGNYFVWQDDVQAILYAD